LLASVVCACSPEKTKNHTIHHVYLQKHGKIASVKYKGADLFSEINIIPLKENDDFLLGRANKLIKCDSFFYVLDNWQTHAIYKYDHNGNPVKRFSGKGGSENEYAEIVDFDINQSSKEILVFCVPPKILYLDFDFNNLGKNNNLGYDYFDRIAGWEDKVFLYNHRDRKLSYLNPETGQSEECFRSRSLKADFINPNRSAFFKTRDNLYFYSQGADTIYIFKDDRFVPFLSLDFDSKEESMRFYEKTANSDITMDDRANHPVALIESIIERNDRFIFIYTYGLVYRICIYNLVTGEYIDTFQQFGSRFSGGFFDVLYGVANPVQNIFEMPGFHEFMKGVKYDFTGKFDFDEEFGNPIIVEQILR
jgi:hypothetical protein